MLAVVIIVGLSAHFLGGRAGPLRNMSNTMTVPAQRAALAAIGWLEDVYGYLYKYDQLLAENEALRAQLADAQEEARTASQAIEENSRLRELLNLKEKHSDFELEPARITYWNPSNWASSFTINKGEDSGIGLGNCVITESGALVGQISELGDSWCTVQTLIDVEMNVGALVGDAGNAAMIEGDFALMHKGKTKLTYLTEGTQLFEGDTILTSGKGGMFPQGLVIGLITSVQLEAGGQTPYAEVEPSCNLHALSHVAVIKSFDVTE